MLQSSTWRLMRTFATAGVLCVLVGCGERIIRPEAAIVREVQRDGYSDRDWAIVLRDNIRYGLVDYDALRACPDALMRYCATLSLTGPVKTPDQFTGRAQTTAYYINAFNALVLRAVLAQRADVPTMYDYSLPQLEYDYQFPLDGTMMTLAQIEGQILQSSDGDVRALLATSRAAVGTPRLMSEPIRPETLDRQLTQAAAEALDLPEILRIDHTTRTIQVWQTILRHKNEFLEYWKSQRRVRTAFLFNVLLEMASPTKRRALQSAVGYQFREAPFDRSLNGWGRRSNRSATP